jgi:hypothetical protein
MPDPKPEVSSRRGLPLDVYAVLLSLAVALLVRLNLIPPVKW